MRLLVKPGARNIKSRSTVQIPKVSHKRLIVQDVKKDREGETLNPKVSLK